jgi:rare lipoprotein A
MRSFLAAVVAASAIAGGASLQAEAAAGTSPSGVAIRGPDSHAGTLRGQLHLARATIDDDDDDERPSRRWRMDGRTGRLHYDAGPRRTRAERHTRTARHGWRHSRHAAGQRRVARRSVNRPARDAIRIPPTRSTLLAVPSGTDITGVASYYWQGQVTATGERYNPEGMTAAHRTLPFGTRVRVTHLGNGRSVDVRINDRGPYIGGRIIDLSRGAAGILGMHQQGLARVKVTVLGR